MLRDGMVQEIATKAVESGSTYMVCSEWECTCKTAAKNLEQGLGIVVRLMCGYPFWTLGNDTILRQ